MAQKLALALLPLLVGSAAAFGGVPSVLPPGRHAAVRGHAPHGRRACLWEPQRRSGVGFLWRSSGGGPQRARRGLLAMAAGDAPRAIKIYNTLARDKVDFTPMAADGKTVKMYTCGPTIYDFAHIGNFRAFLTYDIVKRWLQYCGYEVDHVCNLTDVDDKIIVRMKRDSVGLKELTDKYAQYFFEDLDSLNIIPARCYPRATEHIDDIVEMIDGLVSKGNAYEKDGSYYFDVGSFPTYGKLARLDFDNMQDGAGEGGGITDSEAFAKKNSRDFALWKAFKPEDSSVVWETRLGKGRPGWHIECSAMSRRFLGDSIDIHAGGVDLTFPHHENEIAQSEAFCGCTFCNVWVHNGFVNIDNEKMSKSLGNFRTLREACKDALDVRAFRYLVISSQYRAGLNFTPDVMKGARKTVQRLDKWRANLLNVDKESGGEPVDELVRKCLVDFEAGMTDDLNTPRACAALFGLVKGCEKLSKSDAIDKDGASKVLAALAKLDSILGIFYEVPGREGEAAADDVGEVPPELASLLEERLAAKQSKDFARADEIRDLCAAAGYAIVDTKGGPSSLKKI